MAFLLLEVWDLVTWGAPMMDELRLPPNLPRDNRDGEEVETIKEPMVEYGVAKYVLPGQASRAITTWFAATKAGS